MKRIKSVLIITTMVLFLGACTAQGGGKAQEQTGTQNETQEETLTQEETQTTPDADWNIPETTEMTEEASALFDKSMEGLTGVGYEPVGLLGEKDGVYCILCRAIVVYPDAKPYYALVYVNEDGVQNIWDIWMGAHAEKKE